MRIAKRHPKSDRSIIFQIVEHFRQLEHFIELLLVHGTKYSIIIHANK